MSDDCGGWCAAAVSRRLFLRDVGLAAVGALSLVAAASPAMALAETAVTTSPVRSAGRHLTYTIPTEDSISVDADNDVILARWQNRAYAFSLKCPHRGTQLEWHADEQRVYCPKHKARFQPNGAHDSGRSTRDLDRYDISRQDTALVVDLAVVRRADLEPDAWRAAMVVLA